MPSLKFGGPKDWDTSGKYQPPRNQAGRAANDPVFTAPGGQRFHVQGTPNNWYSIWNDKGLLINARFKEWGAHEDGTVMGEFAVTVGSHQLSLTPGFVGMARLTVDGEQVKSAKGVDLGDGASYSFNNKTGRLKLDTPQGFFVVFPRLRRSGMYLNLSAKPSESATPHGLLGQVFNPVLVERHPERFTRFDQGHGAQGGGVIETLDADDNAVLSKAGDMQAVEYYRTEGPFERPALEYRANTEAKPSGQLLTVFA